MTSRLLVRSSPQVVRPVGRRPTLTCRCENEGDSPTPGSTNKLATIIKRKQQQMTVRLNELGMEGLEERLQSATESPPPDPYRIARLIAEIVPTGRPVLLFEIARPSADSGSSQALAEVATRFCQARADALVVPIDSDDTPEGLGDVFAVTRAALAVASPKNEPVVPVLCRDWFIHPLQVVDAKEAGCAGLIGVIASVTGPKGTPVLSSFAAALGLDAPTEIVNVAELRAMEAAGVPFYGLNLSVGLSVKIPGFGSDIAAGLLNEMPFGVVSLVGVKSIDEARAARAADADALFIRRELVQEWEGREQELIRALIDATCGDD